MYDFEHVPQSGTPAGAAVRPSAARPGSATSAERRATSDKAILEIALEVWAAMRRRPPDEDARWILSAAAELAPADEDRVIDALVRLGAPVLERET